MKKIILYSFLIGIFIPCALFAQVERWVYRYDGGAQAPDYANSVTYGLDGNIYATGDISPQTDEPAKLMVVSLSSDGTERWKYIYPPSPYLGSEGYSLVYGLDDYIYTAGNLQGDFGVISLTPDGSERWIYRYNGPGDLADEARWITYGDDGNIYAAGYSYGGFSSDDDFIVISITSGGTERWIYRYNGANGDDGAICVIYGNDGNIYACGSSYQGTPTGDDFTVISLTSSGSLRWVYLYDGGGNWGDLGLSMVYGEDDNIYVAGYSTGDGTGSDFTVISFTNTGIPRWIYKYNGPVNMSDWARSVIYGSDGNIYVTGFYTASNYERNIRVILLTTNGDVRWVYTYDGPIGERDDSWSITEGEDGNLYITGFSTGENTYRDFIIISLTKEGEERWVYRYNGPGSGDDGGYSIVYGEGNIYAAGYSWGENTVRDFTVISLRGSMTSESPNPLAYNGNRHLAREPNSEKLHLVLQDWTPSLGNIIEYYFSPDGGSTWNGPELIGKGEFPAIALDSRNNPCVAWTGADTLFYARKTSSTWTRNYYLFPGIPNPLMPSHASITVEQPAETRIDSVHILFKLNSSNSNYIKEIAFRTESPELIRQFILESSSGSNMINLDFPCIASGTGPLLHAVW
jgi:hypothetical protein